MRNFTVGTYLRAVAPPAGVDEPTMASTTIASLRLTAAEARAPGDPTAVRMTDTYRPVEAPGYPVRGGEYRAGDIASFPAAEAAALIAAGIAAAYP